MKKGGLPMTRKWAKVVVRSAVLFGAAVVLLAPARAQTPPSAAKAKTSPAAAVQTSRTPQGQPDLGGVWSIAFLTPLQRDPELGNKQFFTPEEAAAYLKKRSQELDAARRGHTRTDCKPGRCQRPGEDRADRRPVPDSSFSDTRRPLPG